MSNTGTGSDTAAAAAATSAGTVSVKHTNGSTVKKLKSSSDRCKWWIGGLAGFLLIFYDKMECAWLSNAILTVSLTGIAFLGIASTMYEKESQNLENLIITRQVTRDGDALDEYAKLKSSDFFYWAGMLALLINGILMISGAFAGCLKNNKKEKAPEETSVVNNYHKSDSIIILRDTIYLPERKRPCTLSRKKALQPSKK